MVACAVGRRLGTAVPVAALALAIGGTAIAAQPLYRLGPGDVLSFDLMDDEELPREIVVGADGRLPVPLLGTVEVAGLTVTELTDLVRERLLARQLLVDPKPLLAVVTQQPIFVLGDVKTPGSYPSRAKLTVEQAVGLAGGLATPLTSIEDHVLQRSKSQTEVEALESEIAREAVMSARLVAQVDGKTEIDFRDVPEIAVPFVSEPLFKTLGSGEARILDADRAAVDGERKQLLEALQETDRSLTLLSDLAKAQQATIGFSKDDLTRKSGLLNRGLNTIGDVSVIQRQLATDEARLLTIYAQMSDGRRTQANLRREIHRLQADRKRDALQLQQDTAAKIEKLVSARKAALNQLYFLSSWTSEAGQRNSQPTVRYKIRRRPEAPSEEEDAVATTPVFPGDVVITRIERPLLDATPPAAPADPEGNGAPARVSQRVIDPQ
jgi:protein involved in polysaccharide export with SLBB domain